MPSVPPYIVIGHVARPHGVRGELLVSPDTDFPERLLSLREALFVKEGVVTPIGVETVRPHQEQFLLKARGIDSRDAAATWRRAALAVLPAQAAPLSEGQHYVFEILGLRVETEAGEVVGTVTEVLRTGSNDVYVVRGPQREVLVPAIASVVTAIDIAGGKLLIRPLAGMLEGR